MIALVVDMKVKEGKGAELESVITGLGEKVLANEDGCKMYQLARSKKDADTYVLIERYVDDAALALHGGTDYFKAAMPKMMGALDGPPKISMFEEV